MDKIALMLRRHWYLPFTFVLAAAGICLSMPSGEDIVNLGWDTFFTLIIIMLSYTGLMKERAFAPIGAFLSMLRFTYFLLLAASLAAFILGSIIGAYAAAISMIPLTLSILRSAERGRYSARTAAVLTIAAVLGSMALPSGSIANIYLAERTEASFVMTMLPLTITGLVLLPILPIFVLGKNVKDEVFIHDEIDAEGSKSMRMLYVCLMIIATLTAMGSFFWFDILILFLVVLAIFDRKVFIKMNWAIPLSFLFLSIFAQSIAQSVAHPAALGIVSEIAGSTAAALITKLPASAEAIRAVNIGGLGLLSGMAGYGAAMRLEGSRKEYALSYLACSIPVIAILSLISILL